MVKGIPEPTRTTAHLDWTDVVRRYAGRMSQTDRTALEEALDQLSPEDRVWLEERLAEYRDALQYLHDH